MPLPPFPAVPALPMDVPLAEPPQPPLIVALVKV